MDSNVQFHLLRSDVCAMRLEELLDEFHAKKMDRGYLRSLVWQLQASLNKFIKEEKQTNGNVRTYSYYKVRKQTEMLDAHLLLSLL